MNCVGHLFERLTVEAFSPIFVGVSFNFIMIFRLADAAAKRGESALSLAAARKQRETRPIKERLESSDYPVSYL